jgi:mono/diheme cytochrome c family protein
MTFYTEVPFKSYSIMELSMREAVKLTALAGIMVIAVFVPRQAQAQAQAQTVPDATFAVDEAMAKKGKTLFATRACSGCHTIGKGRLAGPDLAHVQDRRTMDWLKSWLKDPPAMMETDSTAKALLKEYNNTKMPNMKLSDEDALALIHHMANESKKVKKSSK